MKPAAEQIDQWIREQQTRLGIKDKVVVNSNALTGAALPTVTVMLPSMAAVTRLAHAAADERIAVDPNYAAMCERLDAELAEIIEAGIPGLPRAKPTRRARVPHVMTND